ncbi:hypothetical protein BJY01DRAFT_203634 [Aspergillus pseudoustus]|uniref:Uncharacterized protein n=1 Tax=Aspergillus pseudoustus TaxID=1810923 RepID=A0ABR4KUQ9_9EURO
MSFPISPLFTWLSLVSSTAVMLVGLIRLSYRFSRGLMISICFLFWTFVSIVSLNAPHEYEDLSLSTRPRWELTFSVANSETFSYFRRDILQ